MGEIELDYFDSDYGQMMGCFTHGNERLDTIKLDEFLGYPNQILFLRDGLGFMQLSGLFDSLVSYLSGREYLRS
jgi:hypothetical protein